MGWDDKKQFAFVTKARDADGQPLDDVVMPQGIQGREKLSRPYEYHVLFRAGNGDRPLSQDDIDAMLLAPAAVALGSREGDIVVRGVLSWIQQTDTGTGGYSYVARLEPTIHLLTRSRTSRVFLAKSPVDIVSEVLKEYGLKQREGTTPAQFDIAVGAREAREYTVQYEESDWAFVQRWLDREGIFYWFESGKKGEELVLSDNNSRFTEHELEVPWASRNMIREDVLTDFCPRRRRTAARVEILDYTDRASSALLRGHSPVDERRGFGTVISFGENPRIKAEADRLAKARAERLLAERQTFTGLVNFVRLRAGYTFHMTNHAQAGRYLVTSAEYKVGTSFHVEERTAWREERVIVDTSGTSEPLMGRLEMVACEDPDHPDRVIYRPERTTPWPRIDGVLLGHIEEDTEGNYAQLDAEGRYRVKLPFDLSGNRGSRASHWIRLAEPYAGRGYGTHFPLHRGAEVLVAHVGGDPDRPVIVAAVPNPETKSFIVDETSTQSRIRTASGIQVELEDLES